MAHRQHELDEQIKIAQANTMEAYRQAINEANELIAAQKRLEDRRVHKIQRQANEIKCLEAEIETLKKVLHSLRVALKRAGIGIDQVITMMEGKGASIHCPTCNNIMHSNAEDYQQKIWRCPAENCPDHGKEQRIRVLILRENSWD